MKSKQVKFRRAPETKFLLVDQQVFDKLSPYALKVYGQLRKLTSYTSENDEIEITVKNLAHASGISERKTYDVLNELQFEHFLIQRHNIYHFRFGQINSFDVSQTYGYYKPVQEENTTAPQTPPVDNFDQKLTGTAPHAEPPAPHAYLKKQESFQEVSKKKQNNNPVNPSVFSDQQTVKDHLSRVIANRKDQQPLDDDIVSQGIYYAFDTNKDKSFDSVNKRINIFMKKVKEGKWLIPQGYKGISSQSIREIEEQQAALKREQYKQEAVAAQNIFSAVAQGKGLQGFSEMFKKLKDEVGEKGTNNRGMQKRAV